MIETADAVIDYVPAAVRSLDETEISESRGGIAKDIRMDSRVDPIQSAGDYGPASMAVSAKKRRIRRGRAQSAQRRGDRKCDESLVSNHRSLLFVAAADCPHLTRSLRDDYRGGLAGLIHLCNIRTRFRYRLSVVLAPPGDIFSIGRTW